MKHIEGIRKIGTRNLDEMEKGTPEQVMHWLENFQSALDEEGYPVVLNGTYGYLTIDESWHDEVENIGSVTADWKKENPTVTCKGLLAYLQKTAKFLQVLEPDLKVFVGNKTGPLDSHEFSIFLPYGTTNERHNEIVESCRCAALKAKQEEKQQQKL